MNALANRAEAAGVLAYFIATECERGAEMACTPGQLHEAYAAYCAQRSQQPLTFEQFMEEARRLLPGARGRVWRGIGLPT